VNHLDRQCRGVLVPGQFLPDEVLPADQHDLDRIGFDRANGAFYFGFGGVVAAHRVNSDGHHGRGLALLFADLDDFAALVLAAVRADPVRELGLVAVGAFGPGGRLDRVVGAALGAALGGMSSFRIRHGNSLL
jgi:hypothetical protein